MIISSKKQIFHLSSINIMPNDSNASSNIKKEHGLIKKSSGENTNNTIISKETDPFEILKEQKQNIIDSKQKYLHDALSENQDPSSIKDKLKEYDKKISDINKQINELNQATLNNIDKNLQNDKKNKQTSKTKNNSNGNLKDNSQLDNSDEMMNKLVNASQSMSDVKIISAEKKSESVEKEILETQIELDKGRLGGNPTLAEERVAKIDNNIANMGKNIFDRIYEVNDQVNSQSTANRELINNSDKGITKKNNDSARNDNITSEKTDNQNNSVNQAIIQNYIDNSYDKNPINGKKVNSTI